MRFVAIFEDGIDPAGLDEDLNRRHFDYLKANDRRIVIAGGLRERPAGPYCGALWIIEAETQSEAVRLVEDDPYCRAGLWPNRRLLVWGKAPSYGAVTL